MPNDPIDPSSIPVRRGRVAEAQKRPLPSKDDLSLENLGKLEGRIIASFEKVDPAWFLTEETKKTRERYLYLSAVCVLFLLTEPGDIDLIWPAEVTLKIQFRLPLDLSLICVCLGIGLNYLISARSELAQHTYNWKMAKANSDILTAEIQDYVAESERLIESSPDDAAYAPDHLKSRLKILNDKARKMKEHFDELSDKNEKIEKWGNRMPYLTFAAPLVIFLSALASRQISPPL